MPFFKAKLEEQGGREHPIVSEATIHCSDAIEAESLLRLRTVDHISSFLGKEGGQDILTRVSAAKVEVIEVVEDPVIRFSWDLKGIKA